MNIQSAFLEKVKAHLPSNISLPDELAEILNISRDSAYRRIRGETVLSLDEAKIVSNRFGISIDDLLSPASDIVRFQLQALSAENFPFDKYLRLVLKNLEMLDAEKTKEVVWYAKDLPIWHYFQYPRLSAFKLFFWDKTFVRGSRLRSENYHQNLVPRELIALALKVWEKYSTIPSKEILSNEALNATLRQIEFAYECGVFGTAQEAVELCDDCMVMMKVLKEQAERGRKTVEEKNGNDKFELYVNEVLIGDNSVLFKVGEKRIVFITSSQFNILSTRQENFCKLVEEYMDNMINKSVLISNTAERERSKFFNTMEKKILDLQNSLR